MQYYEHVITWLEYLHSLRLRRRAQADALQQRAIERKRVTRFTGSVAELIHLLQR